MDTRIETEITGQGGANNIPPEMTLAAITLTIVKALNKHLNVKKLSVQGNKA